VILQVGHAEVGRRRDSQIGHAPKASGGPNYTIDARSRSDLRHAITSEPILKWQKTSMS